MIRYGINICRFIVIPDEGRSGVPFAEHVLYLFAEFGFEKEVGAALDGVSHSEEHLCIVKRCGIRE